MKMKAHIVLTKTKIWFVMYSHDIYLMLLEWDSYDSCLVRTLRSGNE